MSSLFVIAVTVELRPLIFNEITAAEVIKRQTRFQQLTQVHKLRHNKVQLLGLEGETMADRSAEYAND